MDIRAYRYADDTHCITVVKSHDTAAAVTRWRSALMLATIDGRQPPQVERREDQITLGHKCKKITFLRLFILVTFLRF